MTKIIFAILAFQFFVSNANAIQLPDFPFIYAQGFAQKEIPPNIAELNFLLKTFDENPDKAFKSLQQQSLELIKLFKEIGIADDNIESFEIKKTTIRENKNYQELKVLGYDVSQRFNLKLHDLDQYSELMNKLISYRNISDFNSKFDVAERKEIEESLLIDACAESKNRAKNMANSVGGRLDSVFAVSENGFNAIENAYGLSGSSDRMDRMFAKSSFNSNAPNLTFIPSSIKIEKSVNVIYKLTNN